MFRVVRATLSATPVPRAARPAASSIERASSRRTSPSLPPPGAAMAAAAAPALPAAGAGPHAVRPGECKEQPASD